jgi:hypothetical protein
MVALLTYQNIVKSDLKYKYLYKIGLATPVVYEGTANYFIFKI